METRKIGIIGSGVVAQTLGEKLLTLGNPVMISSRNVDAEKDLGPRGKFPSVNQWVEQQKAKNLDAYGGSFADAAEFGEGVFNCTSGTASLEALGSANPDHLSGKILIDIANPIDFSQGLPQLAFCNTESLGEKIQAAFPQARVVKTLNTIFVGIMVDPGQLSDKTDIFIAGNDEETKEQVTNLLLKGWLGWERITDLGDITAARAMEMYLPLWLRLMGVHKKPTFNIKIVQ